MEAVKKKPNVPALRFPEFSGEWRETRLGSVSRFSKGKGLSKEDVSREGRTPCVRYAELYTTYGNRIIETVSFTNLDESELVISKGGELVIPASGETAFDIATASCIIRPGIALGGDLNVIQSSINGVFLSYLFGGKARGSIARMAQGSSVIHLYSNQLKRIKLNLPELAEQEKVAAFLTVVDERFGLLKRKKELLEEYKKGVMQRLFSREIRFKDEEGNEYPEWEEKRLGDLTVKKETRNRSGLELPIYSINNKVGFNPQADEFDGIDSLARGYDTTAYKIISRNTFAYNPARINVGSVGFSGELQNIQVSSLYVCFQTNGLIEDHFLWHYLNTTYFRKEVIRKSEGGVRSYLFYENFRAIRISLPSKSEQNKISDILTFWERCVMTTEHQIDALRKFKSGLLVGMFA